MWKLETVTAQSILNKKVSVQARFFFGTERKENNAITTPFPFPCSRRFFAHFHIKYKKSKTWNEIRMVLLLWCMMMSAKESEEDVMQTKNIYRPCIITAQCIPTTNT